MELVALLVPITACTVRDFPLAQHVNLVLLVGAVLGVHRERIVLVAANALALAAERPDAQLGDALVRVATLLFVVRYRQAGGVLGIRHERPTADALLVVADGVGRLVGAVGVLLAGFIHGCDNGMALVLVDDKVVGTGTIKVYVIAMREVIANNTLLIDLAGFPQFNGLAHTPFRLPAGNEPVLANAQLSFLITVGILRQAGTLSSDLIGRLHNHRFTIGLVTAVDQFTVANTGRARAPDGTALERFAVFVILAAQLDQFTGTNGAAPQY